MQVQVHCVVLAAEKGVCYPNCGCWCLLPSSCALESDLCPTRIPSLYPPLGMAICSGMECSMVNGVSTALLHCTLTGAIVHGIGHEPRGPLWCSGPSLQHCCKRSFGTVLHRLSHV